MTRSAVPLACLIGAAALAYALTAPASINGDGIGYLKQLSTSQLPPGHVGYLPLARLLAAGHRTLAEAAGPLRALSLISALFGLAVFYAGARRVWTGDGALFCTGLLAASHAQFRAAQEVEVYGVATALVICLLVALVHYHVEGDRPRRRLLWLCCAGVAAGLAPLFHLTLALLAPSTLALLWWSHRRLRDAIGCAALISILAALPLLLVLRAEGIETVAGAWRWLGSADHGLPYPLSPLTPLVALWGVARSLISVPYLYQATLLRVALQSLAAFSAWLVLIATARRRAAPAPDQRAAAVVRWPFVLMLAAPLTLFGVYFYPSDTERWVFILPILVLLLGRSISRLAVATVVLVALVNLGLRVPAALDRSEPQRARLADGLLHRRDLVVSPGHGWAEQIGLASQQPAERFPLVFHAGAQRSLAAALRLMHRRIAEAEARGGRVFVARLHDRSDARGFKELSRNFGLSRAAFARQFDRYRPRATSVAELWELQRPAR